MRIEIRLVGGTIGVRVPSSRGRSRVDWRAVDLVPRYTSLGLAVYLGTLKMYVPSSTNL